MRLISEYRNDPVLFCKEILELELEPLQEDYLNHFLVLYLNGGEDQDAFEYSI